MNKNVSKKISVYNFVFTLFIVLYHWKNFYELCGLDRPKYIYNFLDMLGTVAMAGFFTISAFLLYYSAKESADILKKMKRRLYSLLVPMLIWNTLALIFQFAFAKLTHNTFELTLIKLAQGYTFAMFDGPLWYLLAMLLLMLPAPLIIKLRGKRAASIIALITISAAAIALSTFLKKSDFIYADWFERFFRYVPVYALGAFIALNFGEAVSQAKYKQKTAAFVALPIIALIIAYHLIGLNNAILNWIILIIIPAAHWLALPSELFEKVKIRFPLKISFFIYAMHYAFIIPVFNMIAIRLLSAKPVGLGGTVLIHSVLFVLLYLIVLAFAFIAKKILPKGIYNALSGGRG